MPLGSESASLTRSALGALRAAPAAAWQNATSPGPVPDVPTIGPGGYSGGAAALNAVTAFLGGLKAQANYKMELESKRAEMAQNQAYQQAQIDHMRALDNQPTYSLDLPGGGSVSGLNPDAYAQRSMEAYKLMHPKETTSGEMSDYQRYSLLLRGRAEDRLERVANTTQAANTTLRALNDREHEVDTAEQHQLALYESMARDRADTIAGKASTGDPKALEALGLTGLDVSTTGSQYLINQRANEFRINEAARYRNYVYDYAQKQRTRISTARSQFTPGVPPDLGVEGEDRVQKFFDELDRAGE